MVLVLPITEWLHVSNCNNRLTWNKQNIGIFGRKENINPVFLDLTWKDALLPQHTQEWGMSTKRTLVEMKILLLDRLR